MTTRDKCVEILQVIASSLSMENCPNQDGRITFATDWGAHSLTVVLADNSHTHVGYSGCTFEELVDSLHGLLCKGQGLSAVKPIEEGEGHAAG